MAGRRRKRRYPEYVLEDGRIIEVEPETIPTPEEAVKRGFQRAPRTILGLLAGGIAGALIAGPPGAFIMGVIGGLLGLIADQEEIQTS